MNLMKCINLLLKVKEELEEDNGIKIEDSEQVLEFERELGYIDAVINYLINEVNVYPRNNQT